MLSSKEDAKAANVEGEVGGPGPTFKVADSSGEWFRSKSQYPLIDAISGTRFEAGVTTRATHTDWVDKQIDAGAMEAADAPEDAKGKAAKTADPALNDSPKAQPGSDMGAGMQTAVAGS